MILALRSRVFDGTDKDHGHTVASVVAGVLRAVCVKLATANTQKSSNCFMLLIILNYLLLYQIPVYVGICHS
jgi:hypothetical protein